MSVDEKNLLKQCPGCTCTFFSTNDLHLHLKTFGASNHEEEFKKLHRQIEHDTDQDNELEWMPSKYGGNKQIILSTKDPKLAQAIRQQGPIHAGGYTYKFSTDQKWITKEYTGGT